ncbi:MAG TPA: GyrI-like domain-containing protein [Xanthobacteraceae bacterium]|nr:GyrI-like domain-containing protein [Xanthobacteraceae bacterium]
MMTPWRAAALAGVLTLGLTSFALAQAADPAPAVPEPQAQTPPPPPPPPEAKPADPKPNESKPGDPFGEQVTLTPKTIIFLKGNSTWDKALENLQDAFKSVYTLLDKQGIAKAGPPMTIYTQADDTGFQFQAAVPIAEAPKDLPKGDIEVGQSPAGQALKFTHRGSYDSMDGTYEAITDYLDEKRLEAGDSFIEEYETDPVTTPDDKFVITVYVIIK